jgi:YggT family protein
MNILLIVANVLNVYVLLLILRIFLTWFPVDPNHVMVRLLHNATDPWLNLFRNLRLVFGGLDLSPMVAIGVLAIVQGLLSQLAHQGRLSAGVVLAAILFQVWAIISAVLVFFAVLAVIRALAIRFRWGSQPVWQFMDAILQPMAYSLNRVLKRDAFFPYHFTLIILAVVAIVANVAGGLLVSLAAGLLAALPV